MDPTQPRVVRPKVRIYLSVLFLSVLLVLAAKAILLTSRFINITGLTPVTIARLVFDTGSTLRETDGRTNVLLLGIGGGTHEGADLTDTMLILSVKSENKSLAMISIPRDIWSETLKDRVNSAYHYGEAKKKGGGLTLARAIIEDMTGMTIHYGLIVDFSGFKDMIDTVGGVDIDVPKAFTDTEFPIVGREEDLCDGDPEYRCRYETIHFDAGVTHMDGETALKYVRSRHAEGSEGSDFARSKRQQELLLALRNQMAKPGVWLSPTRVRALLDAIDRATDSDMSVGELLTIGKLISRARGSAKQISIEDQLYVPPSSWYGRYVLLPKDSFQVIHEYIKTQLP